MLEPADDTVIYFMAIIDSRQRFNMIAISDFFHAPRMSKINLKFDAVDLAAHCSIPFAAHHFLTSSASQYRRPPITCRG